MGAEKPRARLKHGGGCDRQKKCSELKNPFSLEMKTPYFFNACCKTKDIFTRLHHRNMGHHHCFVLKIRTNLETLEFLQTTWTGRDTDILCELGKTQTEEVYKPLHLCGGRFRRKKHVLKYVKCLLMFTYLYKCAHQHGACIPPGTGSGKSHACWRSLAGSHRSPPHTHPHLEEESRWQELQDSLSKDISWFSWMARSSYIMQPLHSDWVFVYFISVL